MLLTSAVGFVLQASLAISHTTAPSIRPSAPADGHYLAAPPVPPSPDQKVQQLIDALYDRSIRYELAGPELVDQWTILFFYRSQYREYLALLETGQVSPGMQSKFLGTSAAFLNYFNSWGDGYGEDAGHEEVEDPQSPLAR